MFAPRLELTLELGYLFPMKYGAHCYLFTRSWSDAGHPNIRATFDTYHAVTEVRDYAEGLRVLGPHLALVHACENDRGVPGGGLVPWETVFRTLAEIGFDGTIGLETYNSGLGDFAYERGIFQDLCPDGRAFVEKGIAFLRALEARIIDPARRGP
jgi:D-psicose/D-tagatose/L-ribulose 3-epimerase